MGKHEDGHHVYPAKWVKLLNYPGRGLVDKTVRLMEDVVKEGDCVVDFGCGAGFHAAQLARIVGPNGKIICVDLQQEMVDYTQKYMKKRGLADRGEYRLCGESDVGLEPDSADAVLAAHVVHETPDKEAFYRQIFSVLKKGGSMLVVEPKGEVDDEGLERTLAQAAAAGFVEIKRVKTRMSRGALLRKS